MADYVTSEELQTELENLAEELGISVKEALDLIKADITTNAQGIADAMTAINANTDAINAITEMDDNGVQSIAEKLKSLNDMLSNDGELATDLLEKVGIKN